MEVVFAALADSANVSQEGKLNILGIFDSIIAKEFPHRHPFLAFAFTLRAEYQDQNREETVEVSLIDQDGTRLWGAMGTISIGTIEPGQFSHLHQIMNLLLAEFPSPGRYRFRVRLRGSTEPHDTVFQLVKKVSGQG